MTNPVWEKVDRGRYAAELQGHILQAIRKDPPFNPDDRPYLAIVDKVPVGDAWNLNIAKTKAIQHVQRQAGKSKAERLFSNGRGVDEGPPNSIMPAEQEQVSDPVDAMLVGLEKTAVIECKPAGTSPEAEPVWIVEGSTEPDPEHEPEPGCEPPPSLPVDAPAEPEASLDAAMSHLALGPSSAWPIPGQLVISGKLGSGDLLDTLNALRSALELLREHSDVECTINMPPVMKL